MAINYHAYLFICIACGFVESLSFLCQCYVTCCFFNIFFFCLDTFLVPVIFFLFVFVNKSCFCYSCIWVWFLFMPWPLSFVIVVISAQVEWMDRWPMNCLHFPPKVVIRKEWLHVFRHPLAKLCPTGASSLPPISGGNFVNSWASSSVCPLVSIHRPNGQTGRLNKELRTVLGILCMGDPTAWPFQYW